MARQVVVLAFVLFAVFGLAYGADESKAAAPEPSPSSSSLDEPPTGSIIGTLDGDAEAPDALQAGPVGGPVPPGVFDSITASPPSAASALRVSAVAGAATAALVGFFYF